MGRPDAIVDCRRDSISSCCGAARPYDSTGVLVHLVCDGLDCRRPLAAFDIDDCGVCASCHICVEEQCATAISKGPGPGARGLEEVG